MKGPKRSPGGILSWSKNGLYMYGNSYASFEDRNSYAGALAITFSSPVDIVSVDLFDYYRNSYARCYADSCPLLSSDSPHLGTYAVDGFPTSTIVASAPSSSSSNSGSVTSGAQGSPYTYSWAEAGWGYKDNDVADYTFTKDINQTGSRIVFTGSLVGYDSPPEGLDYADRYTAYGISGITFSSTQVPELSSSGATTGLTLILGALLIVTQRRQSAQRTDVFRPVAPASRKTSVGFPSGLS